MRGNRITSIQNRNIELQTTSIPQKRLTIGFGAGILVVGLLTVGLFFAPELTALGLAGIGIGIPLLLLVWFRPEFGLLALLFLTTSIIPVSIIDIRLPIGGGLDLRDLVLIGMFGLLFIKGLSNKTLGIPWWRVGGPLVLFLVMVGFSAFYAIVFQNVESNWALSDLRILSFYAVFFMVMWSIKREDQLQILIIGLFIIADLTTSIIVLQQFIGADNPLLNAMLTTQDWRVYQQAGAVRVVPAGHVLMHFMWFLALGYLIFAQLNSRLKAFFIFQILFIGVGHILTFMRAQWVAMFLGVGLMYLVIAPKYKSSLPKYMILGFSIIFIMALLWGIVGISNIYRVPFVAGVVDRFTTILTPDDTMETGSLQWREFENGKALEAIRKYPLLGVGLGGRYRELTTFHGEAQGRLTQGSVASDRVSRFTRYVHNSYLAIAVKMGLPALIVLAWFGISFLYNGWNLYQVTPDLQQKGLILGVLAGFIGLMVWSFYHAHFIKAESVPVIAMMVGLVGQIFYTQVDGRNKHHIKNSVS